MGSEMCIRDRISENIAKAYENAQLYKKAAQYYQYALDNATEDDQRNKLLEAIDRVKNL